MTSALPPGPRQRPLVIDSHLHVWDSAQAPYAWLDSAPDPLRRDHLFDEVAPAMRRHGVDRAVLVQADDHPGDTGLMLETAARHPEIVGVVASLPLDDPAATAARLEELTAVPLVRGVRTLSHDHPDPEWLLDARVTRSLEMVVEANLTFELVPVEAAHRRVVSELRRRHPRVRLAIDHLASPPLGTDGLSEWGAALTELACDPQLHAKVSGLYAHGGDRDSWTEGDLRELVARAVDAFGPDRLMFGSDWPVSKLGGGYDRVVPTLLGLLGEYGEAARTAMVSANAARFYRLEDADRVALG